MKIEGWFIHRNHNDDNSQHFSLLKMLLRSRLVALYVPRVSLLLFSGSCGFLAYSLVYGACCCCYVASVVSNSVQPHRRQATRLPRPWDSPGKNTGVGCHILLQCMKVKSESEVAQSCPTLSDPMDCSPSGSSIHGIFQARVLEWGAIAFSTHVQFIEERHTGGKLFDMCISLVAVQS